MTKEKHLTGIQKAVIFATSEEELAKQLGLRKQTMQEYVKRGYLPTKHINTVANLYGIAIEELCNPKLLKE